MACEALERAQHEQQKKDAPEAKAGRFVPHMARLWQVVKVTTAPRSRRRR